jgi:polyketide cyclase/dehydrase/lipid transport protein
MQWPKGMEPDRSSVYARNEIKIAAEPANVWKYLCRAALWPTWYANCSWLKFENGAGPDLTLNASFVWKTFGVRVHSTVRVFEPTRSLEWNARAIGLRAYHGWLIEPAVDGAWVLTEETQNGPLPKLLGWYLRPRLSRGHQQWVESLRRVATTG